MRNQDKVRIGFWIGWAIYTIIVIYILNFAEGISKIFSELREWLGGHPVEVASIIWGIFTIALFFDIMIKFDKESWITKRYEEQKLRHSEDIE